VRVTIIEKRPEITRKRRIKLSGQLLLSSMISDEICLFSESQIEERQKAIESMKLELFTMTTSWLELCTPIQTIQEVLKNYYTSSGGEIFAGDQYDFSKNLDSLQYYRNTFIIDCTGYHSVLRDHIQPNNRIGRLVEYVLICTFIFDDRYECNELCKYYKNKNTKKFRVIPSIDDTYMMGERQTNVTCLITIDKNIFEQLSTMRSLTYGYLEEHQREIYDDLNIFLNNLTAGDISKIRFDTMEFIALPLNIYRAKKLTHSLNDNNLNQHWILMGDAAMGGPYFQSISMGYEAAIYFAYLFKHMGGNIQQMLTKYEDYMERLWLKLQIHSKEIQKNKLILQAMCADDQNAVLNTIKIY
jgi:2-polyprenyl-6-methoxyphenol hydroxylase-like FAD-dependent oxidoreductase